MTRRRISSFSTVLALSALGLLVTAATAAGSGGRGAHGHGGHGHGGHGHGIHGHGGHHRGHHGSVRSHRSHGFRFGAHHGLRGHRGHGRFFGGDRGFLHFGGHRDFLHFGGHRSFGGYRYLVYPPYGVYPRSTVYTYPVSYAPVADASVYATPGSVYDPAFQQGVAPQPVDDYPVVSQPQQPQPIYIIVQPAAAGSQQPVRAPPSAAPAPAPRPLAVSGGEAGEVFLSVHPANAAVYLDDDLLGTGDSVAESQEPLVLASGVHVLEVVHPQYPTQRLVFGMPSAGRLQIEFDLEGDRRGRKARVETLDE